MLVPRQSTRTKLEVRNAENNAREFVRLLSSHGRIMISILVLVRKVNDKLLFFV